MTKNTRLSTPAQLQCLRSGAWEPGNEAIKEKGIIMLPVVFMKSGYKVLAAVKLCIHIYYLMAEKAIWLDIARVCVCIFTSRRRVKIQHKSAISSHIAFSTI